MYDSLIALGGNTLVILVFVFLLFPAFLGWALAGDKGRSPVAWFFICLFWPIIGHITLVGFSTIHPVTCPACGGGVPHKKVRRCMNCGHEFKANAKKAAATEQAPEPEASPEGSKEEAEGLSGGGDAK